MSRRAAPRKFTSKTTQYEREEWNAFLSYGLAPDDLILQLAACDNFVAVESDLRAFPRVAQFAYHVAKLRAGFAKLQIGLDVKAPVWFLADPNDARLFYDYGRDFLRWQTWTVQSLDDGCRITFLSYFDIVSCSIWCPSFDLAHGFLSLLSRAVYWPETDKSRYKPMSLTKIMQQHPTFEGIVQRHSVVAQYRLPDATADEALAAFKLSDYVPARVARFSLNTEA